MKSVGDDKCALDVGLKECRLIIGPGRGSFGTAVCRITRTSCWQRFLEDIESRPEYWVERLGVRKGSRSSSNENEDERAGVNGQEDADFTALKHRVLQKIRRIEALGLLYLYQWPQWIESQAIMYEMQQEVPTQRTDATDLSETL